MSHSIVRTGFRSIIVLIINQSHKINLKICNFSFSQSICNLLTEEIGFIYQASMCKFSYGYNLVLHSVPYLCFPHFGTELQDKLQQTLTESHVVRQKAGGPPVALLGNLQWHRCPIEKQHLPGSQTTISLNRTRWLVGAWADDARELTEATYLNLPWQCWHWSPTHPRSQMHDPLMHFPDRQLLSHCLAGEAWVISTK